MIFFKKLRMKKWHKWLKDGTMLSITYKNDYDLGALYKHTFKGYLDGIVMDTSQPLLYFRGLRNGIFIDNIIKVKPISKYICVTCRFEFDLGEFCPKCKARTIMTPERYKDIFGELPNK